MRAMQKELDDLQEVRKREARQAEVDREELEHFRERCSRLEEENEFRQGEGGGGVSAILLNPHSER